MAAVGEKKAKLARVSLKAIKLKDPKLYWKYLEEGKCCLMDI